MYRVIVLCLMLLTSSVAYAQMSESEGNGQIEQAIDRAQTALRHAVSEYEAVYDRRMQLESRLHRERGEHVRGPAPRPPVSSAYLEARSMIEGMDEESQLSAEELEERRLEMRDRLAALDDEIQAVRRVNEALAAHLETLRNEDFPPR